jgi:hypothetical protein
LKQYSTTKLESAAPINLSFARLEFLNLKRFRV